MDSDETMYTLNIEKCINDTSRPAPIRQLFVTIRDHGYITVGQFFKNLTDQDLTILSELMDLMDPKNTDAKAKDLAAHHLTLLGIGLTAAEGLVVNESSATDSLGAVVAFIAMESLARNNVIEVFHDKWTMDPLSSDVMAKCIDQ